MRRRIVSTFSLLALLWCAAQAANYSALEKQFLAAKDQDARVQALTDFQVKNSDLQTSDPFLSSEIDSYLHNEKPTAKDTEKLGDEISERARLEGAAPPPAGAAASAKSIVSSPVYRKNLDSASDSNWIAAALDHLKNLFSKPPDERLPSGNLAGASGFAMYMIVGILVCAILAFLVYVISQFRARKGLSRKASALLEEDEPERTADEWLELADGLTRQGRYREAVRCLYLACLLRFDESGISRFERGETNWEHLARFRLSPKKPAGLEFLEQTRAFDLVWYGKQVKGIEDVERFRAWYTEVMEAIRGGAVAA